MGGLKLGGGGGGDNRNALLQSIQMGAKLKKVQTVDKSGPLIAGKVSGAGSGGSAAASSSPSTTGGVRRPTAAVGNGAGVGSVGAGAPKLGGIFEGLSSMPKLKPVGSRGM